jgi:hypothetical protein
MPALTLVQHTQAPAQPMHPDTRTTEALHTAIQAAWQDGHGRGEHQGYLAGWRSGLLCGACWGGLLVAITVAAARGAGWL